MRCPDFRGCNTHKHRASTIAKCALITGVPSFQDVCSTPYPPQYMLLIWLSSTHMKLLDVRSPTLLGWNHGHFHDLDGGGSGPMPCTHVTVWNGDNKVELRCILLVAHLPLWRAQPRQVFRGSTTLSFLLRILTALCHCASNREVTVLPIHVVSAAARVVSQPDTDILDLCGRFVTHLEGVRR